MCEKDYDKEKKISKPTCVVSNHPWFFIYPLKKKKRIISIIIIVIIILKVAW
jgi:hypothetical protein